MIESMQKILATIRNLKLADALDWLQQTGRSALSAADVRGRLRRADRSTPIVPESNVTSTALEVLNPCIATNVLN